MLTEEVSVTDVEVAVNTYSLFSVVEMAYIWLAPSHPTWLIQGFRQQAGIAFQDFADRRSWVSGYIARPAFEHAAHRVINRARQIGLRAAGEVLQALRRLPCHA